eukprot:CAMPEP_0201649830 /NCGR_PEP_ID=MMETSP0493-20130528/40058_1 /ASSEMBLY_ACC=CAM_ASM_000838 /TAXON_ID=420259 /ORGANISM="Thalassiosira gravida, Strain GMp14c1" /LENGTH=39 /DNA_ID= /DNA_START= /DNA_END= /DNA_ORIENTATION=
MTAKANSSVDCLLNSSVICTARRLPEAVSVHGMDSMGLG